MSITYRQHQDTRDGKIYNCVLMPDGRWWSAEDISYAGAYSGAPGYYTKAQMLGACPPGAHIPTGIYQANEWLTLIAAAGGDSKKLRSASGWSLNGTDDYGLNLKPAGYYLNTATSGENWLYQSDGSGLWGYDASTYSYFTAYTPSNNFQMGTAGSNDPTGKYSKAKKLRFIVDVFNEPIPPTKIKGAFSGSGVKAYFTNHNTATLELPISAQTTTELTIDKDFISFWGPFLGNVRILVVDGEYISEWKDWNFNA